MAAASAEALDGSVIPRYGLIVTRNGVDGFKDRQLHDRDGSALGEGTLLVGDRRIHCDRIPIQNGIGSCDCRYRATDRASTRKA